MRCFKKLRYYERHHASIKDIVVQDVFSAMEHLMEKSG